MSKITFFLGLPGSGKSSRMEEYIQQGIPVFDDFMRGSPPEFAKCKHLPQILQHIEAGAKIVMADIRLVIPAFRQEVLAGLNSVKFDIEWICFENNAEQCRKNSARRVIEQAINHERELELISQLTRDYVFPPGAVVVNVAVPV